MSIPKKERLAKIREILHKMVEETDMTGIVFFGGVSPDDQDEEDHDIPMFYSAAGPHVYIFSLVGKMMADLALRLEQEQKDVTTGTNVKEFVLSHMVAALNSALYPETGDPGIESKDGLPPDQTNSETETAEDVEELAKRMVRTFGMDKGFLIVNKKGGNA